ncbi:MAG: hypothetical protein ACE5L7_10010 [Candidatus Aminicenantales bacterium]
MILSFLGYQQAILELSDMMKPLLAIFTSFSHQAVDLRMKIYLLSCSGITSQYLAPSSLHVTGMSPAFSLIKSMTVGRKEGLS